MTLIPQLSIALPSWFVASTIVHLVCDQHMYGVASVAAPIAANLTLVGGRRVGVAAAMRARWSRGMFGPRAMVAARILSERDAHAHAHQLKRRQRQHAKSAAAIVHSPASMCASCSSHVPKAWRA